MLTTRIPTQHTRYQGNEFYLDGGVLMATAILPDGTPEWGDPVEVDLDHFDGEELWAEANAARNTA